MGRAGRDLEGVRRCILHAVWQAQGHGCSAGFIGVSIGGDRTSGYEHAKLQLFRPCDDANPNPDLARLEAEIMEEGNKLNIGTMGFGGRITLLGCKIGLQNRLPASFFVSVAYDCWAFRRLTVWIDAETGRIQEWEQRAVKPKQMAREAGFPLSGNEIRLQPPLTEEDVRRLRVGDVVLISGPMVTGRDQVHHYLMEHDAPVNLEGALLYHCGPVMLKDEQGHWKVSAAGPTTSSREEPYQADILRRFKVRAVMGKGGMGARTSKALEEVGAVYLNAIGGAAQFYARCLTEVRGVHLLEEFGVPEAIWELEARNFPAIVTMDSHGGSLHAEVQKDSGARLEQLREPATV
jgi:fumarate hydratase class I